MISLFEYNRIVGWKTKAGLSAFIFSSAFLVWSSTEYLGRLLSGGMQISNSELYALIDSFTHTHLWFFISLSISVFFWKIFYALAPISIGFNLTMLLLSLPVREQELEMQHWIGNFYYSRIAAVAICFVSVLLAAMVIEWHRRKPQT